MYISDYENKIFFTKPIKDSWVEYIVISNYGFGIYLSPTYKTFLDSEKYINAQLFRRFNEG